MDDMMADMRRCRNEADNILIHMRCDERMKVFHLPANPPGGFCFRIGLPEDSDPRQHDIDHISVSVPIDANRDCSKTQRSLVYEIAMFSGDTFSSAHPDCGDIMRYSSYDELVSGILQFHSGIDDTEDS